MIHVLAYITVLPGNLASVLTRMRENIPAVRAEAGCIAYAPAMDTEDAGPIQTPLGPNTFVVVEQWASLDALKAHAAAPHMKAYAEATRHMIHSRVIHVLSPV